MKWICKVCGYGTTTEPKEQWQTCPNCDSFKWMKEGERNDIHWTTEPPTVEGWYWVYTKYQENFVEKKKVVLLYLNSEAVFQYEPDDYEFFPDEKNFTHFLGPLPLPEPPKE